MCDIELSAVQAVVYGWVAYWRVIVRWAVNWGGIVWFLLSCLKKAWQRWLVVIYMVNCSNKRLVDEIGFENHLIFNISHDSLPIKMNISSLSMNALIHKEIQMCSSLNKNCILTLLFFRLERIHCPNQPQDPFQISNEICNFGWSHQYASSIPGHRLRTHRKFMMNSVWKQRKRDSWVSSFK